MIYVFSLIIAFVVMNLVFYFNAKSRGCHSVKRYAHKDGQSIFSFMAMYTLSIIVFSCMTWIFLYIMSLLSLKWIIFSLLFIVLISLGGFILDYLLKNS